MFDVHGLPSTAVTDLIDLFTLFFSTFNKEQEANVHLVPVVHQVDHAIQQINLYPLDSVLFSGLCYPTF